ncbi:hypothetical protein IAQ61_005225 [Plenodomus lingam]|uniref:uncharacterized protein n=1 Tax=Leptosphaeria maculans TaxID=5022 RepID=UPI0033286AD6|nr:hypothetical protein IAQ61_005225 [Plenodomus lingam]
MTSSSSSSPPPSTSSPLLHLPRELRDRILDFLSLPEHVYTSTATPGPATNHFRDSKQAEKTYVDTRIYLPSCPPTAMLATCTQLRQECLEHHAHRLNSSVLPRPANSKEKPTSAILAERLGTEFMEETERACDNGLLRITVEVDRKMRGPMGYTIPAREQLSPRFLALVPLMQRARKLQIDVWPGYEWWNGGPQPWTDKYGNLRANVAQVSKPNSVTVAIGRILENFPCIQHLDINVLMQASEARGWDLPDRKWENLQPWLDTPITVRGQTLEKSTRNLTISVESSQPESFYTQLETRHPSRSLWVVERKGDMLTPTMRSLCQGPDDFDFFASLFTQESFARMDNGSTVVG